MLITLFLRLFRLAYGVIDIALWVYCISSWFAGASPKVYQVYCYLGRIIEPLIAPIRKLLRPITYKIGIDFSIYVTLLLLQFIYNFIVRIIYLVF